MIGRREEKFFLLATTISINKISSPQHSDPCYRSANNDDNDDVEGRRKVEGEKKVFAFPISVFRLSTRKLVDAKTFTQ
jgi:hypothetical protein